MISIVLIGLSLSIDALAVSISTGISIKNSERFYSVRAALFFGIFQFGMPVIGWYLGTTFRSYIEKYDAWIAFILLACIGGKMIIETYSKKGDDERSTTDIRNLLPLTMLAVATSIDALAVGISFSVLKQGIWIPAAIIGGVTFAVCLAGFEFGKKLGHLFEKKAQVVGGLVLIGIGIKILIEDLIGS